MKNNRSLVTGAAGFLGSHLVDQLIKLDHEVVALDILPIDQWTNLSHWENSPKLKRIQIDINQILTSDPNFKDIDFIFHLAGIECSTRSLIEPELFFGTNVMGTMKVLEAAKESGAKRIIYASSSEVYGEANTPTLETDQLCPQSPSALSKMQAEENIFHWSSLFNIEAVSLRIFNCYGPRDNSISSFGNGFASLIAQAIQKTPLTFSGEKEQVVDFVYCTDVANAFVTAATQGRDGEAYNIGSGKPHTLEEVATLLKSNQSEFIASKADIEKVWADISKFQFDSNWQPRVPLASGIEFCLEESSKLKNNKTWNSKELIQFLEPWKKTR